MLSSKWTKSAGALLLAAALSVGYSQEASAQQALFPIGRLDQDLQQVDLRDTNSWRLTLAEVPTAGPDVILGTPGSDTISSGNGADVAARSARTWAKAESMRARSPLVEGSWLTRRS